MRQCTKGYYIKQLKMDCQPTEFTALLRHRAVFSWAQGKEVPTAKELDGKSQALFLCHQIRRR